MIGFLLPGWDKSAHANAYAAAVVASLAFEAGTKQSGLIQPVKLLSIKRSNADSKLRVGQRRIGQNRVNPVTDWPFVWNRTKSWALDAGRVLGLRR